MTEKEINAVIEGEESLGGEIHLDNIRGPQGYTAYELYLMNLPEGETPLSEAEWIDSFSKTNYYKVYKRTYYTEEENESVIPIGIDMYNETAILEVYIESFFLVEGVHYTIEDKNIILTEPLDKNAEVHIVVKRTVVATSETLDLLKGEKGENGKDGKDGKDAEVEIITTEEIDEILEEEV